MLRESANAFEVSRQQRRKERQQRPWGFEIRPDNPLRFRETRVEGLRIRVDLFLSAYWDKDPADSPTDLRVVVRIWSLDPKFCVREEWDAPAVASGFDPGIGRVMLRFHFDLANPSQAGPRYHFQVGGNARPEELHWFPEALAVPRLMHAPMDLVLTTELVAATFYREEYDKLSREPAWKGSRRVIQEHLLAGYFSRALGAIDGNESVLDVLWNACTND